jgi:hypothetical protein
MKYLRKFNEGSIDGKSIWDWCREMKISPSVTINNDNTVDVNSFVDIRNINMKKIPIQFGIVEGTFNCGRNFLTSLKGCPIKVGNEFFCYDNKLKSLKFGPKTVGNHYDCTGNKLISLEGAPFLINRDFDCSHNKLQSLIGGPKTVLLDYVCTNNKLTSLEGSPEKIGGKLYCIVNPIYPIYQLFPNHESYLESLDQKYFRPGNKIVKRRFQKALAEINGKLPEIIKGYEYI